MDDRPVEVSVVTLLDLCENIDRLFNVMIRDEVLEIGVIKAPLPLLDALRGGVAEVRRQTLCTA